jgi:hypothetical protein
MQDSRNRGWDEQFVDQAWGEMSRLLDEELPVAVSWNKHRRGLLLVLFFLSGLVLGGVSIYLTDTPMIGYFPIPQPAVAIQTKPAQPINTLSDKVSNEIPESALVEKITRPDNKETAPSARQKAIRLNESVVSSATGKYEQNATEKDADLQREPLKVSPLPEILSLSPGQIETVSDVLEESLFIPVEELAFLQKSALVDSLISAQEQTVESYLLPPVVASAPPARLRWGAELGSNYYENPGYFGGLNLNYHLGGRWQLQGGLHYGQMVSDLNNTRQGLVFATKEEADFAQRDPGTGLTNNLDQQQEANAIAELYYNVDIRLQQLSSPVQLMYRLNKKWQLATGVQLHYLLVAKRPVQATTEATALNYSAYDRQLTGVAASDNAIDSQLFHNWNLGATFGTTFQATDRWAVHLRYQYGLFNWLETDRFFITPTNLQLSAVYHFNK